MKQKQNFVPFCFLLFPSPHCPLCRFVEPALVRLSRILLAQEHICGKDQAILLKQPLDISGSQLEFCSLMMSLLTGFFSYLFPSTYSFIWVWIYDIIICICSGFFLLIILSFSCPSNNNPLLSFDFIIVTAFYFASYSLLILIRFWGFQDIRTMFAFCPF